MVYIVEGETEAQPSYMTLSCSWPPVHQLSPPAMAQHAPDRFWLEEDS